LEKCHESAKLTQYWIPKEGEYDLGSNGQPIKLTGAKVKALKTNEGKLIAKVAPNTYTAFQMEGSGLLQDGRLINLAEHKNAFMVLDRSKTPFGIGPHGQSLVPWISVAANDIDIGTHLYIKQLDGVTLPNGLKHNGCVRVDDEGWSFNGCHIDFFVLQYKAFEELVDILPETVSVVEKQCTL
ncbi:hypothetical protein BDF20DRAFT_800700, partial [Mycotypha africana]|uniref:uncharacterized protein n=1 Tax=Mycotypha africana TaxID=64632 RepID=UPI002300DCF8